MATKRTVLVVDDETGIPVLCQQLLETASFQVQTAVDSEEALAQLTACPFDLLLTDLHMPGMDGFELLRRARALQPDITVVVMTGYRTVEYAIRALREGVDGIVIKPGEIGPELVKIVEHSLTEHRKKQTGFDPEKLPDLLGIGGPSLLETSPAQAEKLILRTLIDILGASHAGFYQRNAGADDFQLLASAGKLPENGDPFWQVPAVAAAFTTETQVRLVSGSQNPDIGPILQTRGWSSAMLVSLRRKKDHDLFLVAREDSRPVFQQKDLELLALLTRQAAVTIENCRLFHGLASLAQKIERAGGLLPEAARMSALDQLAPAASAEVVNPLQSLKNNLFLTTRRDLSADRIASSLEGAKREIYRLEGNYQRLQTILGQPETESTSLDIESLIGRVVEAFQPLLREKGIQARVSAARPMPAVSAARGALEQALMHVLLNAVEAMELATTEKLIYIDMDLQPGGLLVAIEDSGEGVTPGTEEQIFKPFFSTRAGHHGIGLMVCQRFLESAGGRLALGRPVRGTGARFEIFLPSAG